MHYRTITKRPIPRHPGDATENEYTYHTPFTGLITVFRLRKSLTDLLSMTLYPCDLSLTYPVAQASKIESRRRLEAQHNSQSSRGWRLGLGFTKCPYPTT
jgi:hypothetical protein